MKTSDVKTGARVRIVAADEFYAYVDGWEGVIPFPCWKSGYVIVHCKAEGRTLEFLVPPDQLQVIN
ncbi:MAG: hypothetical protein ACXWJD_03990 [Burkholderiaceae bacterium]